jgi:hypothetical protein
MSDQTTNGASEPNPAVSSGLGEAITRHAAALMKAARMPNGIMGINPAQLYCDGELHAVRIEVLFEALVEAGVLDPATLAVRLRDKLNAESDELEREEPPQIQVASGAIPRTR